MSLLLRHRPETADLELNTAGWASLADLVDAVRRQPGFAWVDEHVVREVVAQSEKQRFAIAGDPPRIRATYGHSIPVDVEYEPVPSPPPVLYHGTTRRALPKILREGLKSMQRHYVFLTATAEEAAAVGRRRDPQPVILEVDTDSVVDHGYDLYRTPGGLYLTEYVPPAALQVGGE